MKAKAIPGLVEFADDSVALAMKHTFSQTEICDLDIAGWLKELLYKRKYELNSLLQSDATAVSRKIGIEEYVDKIIIGTAKKDVTE